ncbi:MAG: hypothetical protein PVJ21_12055 [Anaerolineales bacterium]|jgi:hypothetical protein
MPQIHFNGKTYNDLAEMPATEREAYEQLMSIFKDEDQDGTPDIFQGDVVGNLIEIVKKASGDPKAAAGLERMSPEMRANISKGVARLYELGLISGVPDLPEEWPSSPSEQAPSWDDSEIRASKPIIQSPSAIQDDTGPRWLPAVVILVAVSLCVAGMAAFIFFSQGF